MLGKLIKYDFKAMAKNLFPIYIVMFVLTLIFSIMIRNNLEEGFFFIVFSALFSCSLSGSIFATIYFAVMRFRNGLLKDEGYLSFALPVTTATHIAAKVCNALIWGCMEFLALAIAIAIMGMVIGSVKEVYDFMVALFIALNMAEEEVLWGIFRGMLILSLETISAICMIYCSLAISHLFEKHRKLLIVAFLIIVSVLRSYLLNLFIQGSDYNAYRMDQPFWYLLPILCIAIYSFATWYILDKKLNLE